MTIYGNVLRDSPDIPLLHVPRGPVLDEDVGRLQVPVHDPLQVHGVDADGHLLQEADQLWLSDAVGHEVLLQVRVAHLHDHVHAHLVLVQVHQLHNVRAAFQRSHDLDLALQEHFHLLLHVDGGLRDDFDCDVLFTRLLPAQEHRPERALAQLTHLAPDKLVHLRELVRTHLTLVLQFFHGCKLWHVW